MQPLTNVDWHRRIQSAGGLKEPSAVPFVEPSIHPVVIVDDLTTTIDPGSERREGRCIIDTAELNTFFPVCCLSNPAGSGLYVRVRAIVLSYTAATFPVIEFGVVPVGPNGTLTRRGAYVGVLRGAGGNTALTSTGVDQNNQPALFFTAGQVVGRVNATQTPVRYPLDGVVLDEGQNFGWERVNAGVTGQGFDGWWEFEEIVKRRQ